MPHVSGIVETSVYVTDLPRAAAFYRRVFDLETLVESERLVALGIAGRQVLLLFCAGLTNEPLETSGGVIPGHTGMVGSHFAFSIDAAEVAYWQERFRAEQVEVESVVDWPKGGRSVYVRDPDGNLVELATPGIWAVY